jgi:hypothetical protein
VGAAARATATLAPTAGNTAAGTASFSDDFKTQPTDDSGARVACGVITKS